MTYEEAYAAHGAKLTEPALQMGAIADDGVRVLTVWHDDLDDFHGAACPAWNPAEGTPGEPFFVDVRPGMLVRVVAADNPFDFDTCEGLWDVPTAAQPLDTLFAVVGVETSTVDGLPYQISLAKTDLPARFSDHNELNRDLLTDWDVVATPNQIRAEATFLLARLSDAEEHIQEGDYLREYTGHVEPSIARLKALLEEDQ